MRGGIGALLRLDPDDEHSCLGEDPNSGWVQLSRLSAHDAKHKSLSVAGYPSDKDGSSLWRQDSAPSLSPAVRQTVPRLVDDGLRNTAESLGVSDIYVRDGVLHVVAIMHGHIGVVVGNEILPKWNPKRANLAVDIGDIISSNPDLLKLIEADIARFHHPNPAQVRRWLQDRASPDYLDALPKIAWTAWSPGLMPSSAALPPAISSTARTGFDDEMRSVESGFALAATCTMVLFALMKIMSSGISVFFIHSDTRFSSPRSKSMPASGAMLLRNISPRSHCSLVIAISTVNRTGPLSSR